MNISLNWLKEFVNLSNINPEDIKNKLTDHTVEVEQISQTKDQFKNIIVAKVLEVKKHPQADKLQITLIDSGEENNLQVVCGAPNVSAGQLVALAKIGAILPNGLEIKSTQIRGIESNGMLCAEDELGLGLDHTGIMVLNSSAKIGQSLGDYLKLDETILEIDNKSISNRPDLWNHYGIARELSVIFDKKLKEYETKKIKIKKTKDKTENVAVEIKAKNLCKKYIALKIDNIKIEESPSWLKNKLKVVGLNPINNIVDITNYVMFEIGQPLHAFDAENIKKIIVRKANKNETLITLDDKEQKLIEDDLVIASDSKAIALAGIMGGKNSEINNTTNSIILESANFDAVSIRKTGSRLNIRTDAAIRFEKGLDPNLCLIALEKASELIKQVCPQAIWQNDIIIEETLKDEERIIALNLNWAERFIGQKIDNKKIKKILENLGLIIKNTSIVNNEEVWEIIIPSWRKKDLQIKEDIIEEITRIYGYNNIIPTIPADKIIPPEKDPEAELSKKIKKILAFNYKMTETYNYSYVNEEQLTKLNLDSKNYIRLLNPLSNQHTMLRQTLITNLLANVKNNQSKYDTISLFEIENVFLNIAGGPNKDNKHTETLPYQEKKIGLILSENSKQVFNTLKNIIFNAGLEIANDQEIDFYPTESIISWANNKEKCLIILNGKEIGYLASLNNEVLNKNGIKKQVAYAEISLKLLLFAISNGPMKQYQAIPKFPAVNRDLAFVIDQKILYNDISQEIKKFHPLIKKVELFDVYSGENLENNKKSLAFHVVYQSDDQTLNNEEVNQIQTGLIKVLQEKFSAHIRDF
ncbi:MAG TPA: phenylalanine--tRNA ligase subunit beta [bacterium]|nr:phenylalanine--tRNA ligase subunit beta [bacterium]